LLLGDVTRSEHMQCMGLAGVHVDERQLPLGIQQARGERHSVTAVGAAIYTYEHVLEHLSVSSDR